MPEHMPERDLEAEYLAALAAHQTVQAEITTLVVQTWTATYEESGPIFDRLEKELTPRAEAALETVRRIGKERGVAPLDTPSR